MPFREKTVKKKREILRLAKEGLPDTAIGNEVDLDRHTVKRIREEGVSKKHMVEENATLTDLAVHSKIEEAIASETKRIQYVGNLARNVKIYSLLSDEFEKAGISPVTPSLLSIKEIVDRLRLLEWRDDHIVFATSWICELYTDPQFDFIKNPDGTVDKDGLYSLFNAIAEIRKFCSLNGIEIDRLLHGAKAFIHLNSQGISTAHIAKIDEFLKQAFSRRIEPEQLISRLEEILEYEEKIVDAHRRLDSVNEEISRLVTLRGFFGHEVSETQNKLRSEKDSLDNLKAATRGLIQDLNVLIRDISGLVSTINRLPNPELKDFGGKLHVSLTNSFSMLNSENRWAIVQERIEEDEELLKIALRGDSTDYPTKCM